MITNKYYIIPTALPDNIKPFLVGNDNTHRLNKTGTKAVVKRRYNDNETRPEFNAFLEYDHASILIEMQKPEWTNDDA